MTTPLITITKANLNQLRPGDILVALDGDMLEQPLTVTGPLTAVPGGGPAAVPLHTGANLYPTSHIADSVLIRRPTPAAPARPRTRTFGTLTLTHREGGWWTEDNRYEIRTDIGGWTECEQPHPVRLTASLLAAARECPGTVWAADILAADRAGRRGYLCPGGAEHARPEEWMVWDHQLGDYATHDMYGYRTFRAAAADLAADLKL